MPAGVGLALGYALNEELLLQSLWLYLTIKKRLPVQGTPCAVIAWCCTSLVWMPCLCLVEPLKNWVLTQDGRRGSALGTEHVSSMRAEPCLFGPANHPTPCTSRLVLGGCFINAE